MNNVVLVPVYKDDISGNEKISLIQCFKILQKHAIILFAPESLNTEVYTLLAKQYGVSLREERFSNHYFQDIKGYNRLMLSKEFYTRFLEFECVLIYQLDCFVFKDEFDYWCNKGYDYIGSPWSVEPHLKGIPLLKKRLHNWKKRMLYKYRKGPNDYIKYHHFEDTVGNGGFSLRRVKAMLRVIDIFEKKGEIEKFRQTGEFYYQEDIFFGFEAKSKLKIPSYKEAALFSVEEFSKWYTLSDGVRPFGCHSWNRDFSKEDWILAIEECGYTIEM